MKRSSSSSSFSSPPLITGHDTEFFDAGEASLKDSVSDDGTSQASFSSFPGQDAEIEIRFQEDNLRGIKAEEAFCASLHRQWNEMSRRFTSIGLSFPILSNSKENRFAELEQRVVEFCEQINEMLLVARLVVSSVTSGAVKAEQEEKVVKALASKSRDIARLREKLQYYELLSHEMSKRNQEAVEITQRKQRKRMIRQQQALGCIAGGLFIGTTALLAFKLSSWKKM